MKKQNSWTNAGSEPSLAELFSDPIMDALMRADSVKVKDALRIFQNWKRHLAAPRVAPRLAGEPALERSGKPADMKPLQRSIEPGALAKVFLTPED